MGQDSDPGSLITEPLSLYLDSNTRCFNIQHVFVIFRVCSGVQRGFCAWPLSPWTWNEDTDSTHDQMRPWEETRMWSKTPVSCNNKIAGDQESVLVLALTCPPLTPQLFWIRLFPHSSRRSKCVLHRYKGRNGNYHFFVCPLCATD